MRVLALAFACMLLATGPAAAWSFRDDAEPSTQLDRSGDFMWTGENAPGRVYFDVVAQASVSGQNPNDALLGARIPPPDPSYTAYLGVWRDCNGDGYLGTALGGLLDYPGTASATGWPEPTPACPYPSPFNGPDGWIHELLWIGPQKWSPNPDDITYVIPGLQDNPSARVWGDLGLPGSSPEPACAAWPLPRGTTSSTGAALGYADCFDGHAVAQALGFPDPAHPERAPGPLDQHAPVSLFGDPSAPGGPRVGLLQRDSGRSAYTAWDCNQRVGVNAGGGPRSITIQDPEPASDGYRLAGSKGVEGVAEVAVFEDDPHGGPPSFHRDLADPEGWYVSAPAPTPPHAPDAGGSLYDAAQGAEVGAVERCDPNADVVPMLGLGPGPLLGKAPLPESDNHGVDPRDGRRQNDFAFDFQNMRVSNQEGGTVAQGNLGAPAVGDMAGHGLSLQDFGLAALRDVNGAGPGWHSLAQPLLGPRTLTRSEATPVGARHVTFYAHFLPGDVTVPLAGGSGTPGNVGTYGDLNCDAIGRNAGVRGGWSCDPAQWWVTPDASARPRNRFSGDALGAVVGDTYELRDVDCTDGGVGPVSAPLLDACS
jgi:hypothetical protein